MRNASASTASVFSPIRENVFTFPNAALIVRESPIGGRDAVLRRLSELTNLPRGWDGYRAPAVSFENAAFALRMIEVICGRGIPAPQIVPGSGGDLQVEWHLPNGEVELHVKGPNNVDAWFRKGEDEAGASVQLKNDFTDVGHWMAEISEPAGAADTAAA